MKTQISFGQIQISGRAYHTESYRNREGKLRTKEVDTFHARCEMRMLLKMMFLWEVVLVMMTLFLDLCCL